MSDIACFINIFSTDLVTKNLERVDGASSPLPWYLWATEVHPGVQRKCIQGFLCFFPLNSTFNIYILPQPSIQILLILLNSLFAVVL